MKFEIVVGGGGLVGDGDYFVVVVIGIGFFDVVVVVLF